MNGNIFFELFLVDLDEKMTLTGYRRQQNQKQSETMIIYSNNSPHGEHHVQGEKAFFWIFQPSFTADSQRRKTTPNTNVQTTGRKEHRYRHDVIDIQDNEAKRYTCYFLLHVSLHVLFSLARVYEAQSP